MKMHGFISVLVFLLAGGAQAVNTAPLNGQSHEVLGDSVKRGGSAGQTLDASSPSDGVLQPVLEGYSGLSAADMSDLAASAAPGGEALVGPSAGSLIDGLNSTTDWPAGRHWSTDPEKYTDAGFVDASSRVDLPAFAEIDWVATPLPTAKETSLMEVLVFPALGTIIVVFIVAVLIVRVRSRRARSRAQQLLRV